MTFRLKKSSTIDRRLKDLEKEIAGLGGEIKAAARNVSSKKTAVPQRIVQEPLETEPDPRRAGRFDPADASPRKCEGEAVGIQGHDREKFVNYFSAHNFTELRPMRESGNVLRNKAIMMAVIAALAVIGFLFHMFGR